MSGLRRLRGILERWQGPVDDAGAHADADGASAVASAWPGAVGPDVARRTRPGKLRDGMLTVYTAGSTWSHQLTFLAPTILHELNVCCAVPVRRLRFVVATGKTKALLDGMTARPDAQRRAHAGTSAADAESAEAIDVAGGDVDEIVARLRRRQATLDRRRIRDGWSRCDQCGCWREPAMHGGLPCRTCENEARREAGNAIERILVDAPWLRAGDVAAHARGDDEAYDRVRRRLLSRWEEQLFAMRRRLRRKELLAADRMVAWSYLMLRTGMQQRAIARAVIADVLGAEWAQALMPAPQREATASSIQKHQKTTARVFTRRDNT